MVQIPVCRYKRDLSIGRAGDIGVITREDLHLIGLLIIRYSTVVPLTKIIVTLNYLSV